jgi:N-acetylmuramoyl-L-alanine amidase
MMMLPAPATPTNQPEDACLQLVFPTTATEHTTCELESFILGQLKAPATALWVQGEPALLSAEGYFAHVVTLHDGLNTFYLETDLGEAHTVQIRQWVPALQSLNQSVFFKEASLQLANGGVTPTPAVYQWHDKVTVQCLTLGDAEIKNVTALLTDARGRAVTQARLIAKQVTENPNTRYHWENREAIFAQLHQTVPALPKTIGWFEGVLQLPPFWLAGNALTPQGGMPLYLELFAQGAATGLSGERWKPSGVKIEVWNQAKFVQTTAEETVIRSSASPNGARITTLPKQTSLAISGQQGDWFEVSFANGSNGFVDAHQTTPLESGLLPSVALKTVIVSQLEAHQWHITCPLPRKIPFFVAVNEENNQLVLTLDAVEHQCDFIHFQPFQENPPLGVKVSTPCNGQTVVTVQLPNRFCGYKLTWQEQGLVLSLRSLPTVKSACTIVIDAGHGGEELGAIGLDGKPEKDWTLTMAKALQQQLKLAGFPLVQLTRSTDVAIALTERQAMLEEIEAHISLSIHANALPEGRNPWQFEGVSAFYYHAHARRLALAIVNKVVNQAKRPNDGLFFDNLAMTRPSHCLAVLVEYGYFINPKEYPQLQQLAVQQALVAATVQALEGLF